MQFRGEPYKIKENGNFYSNLYKISTTQLRQSIREEDKSVKRTWKFTFLTLFHIQKNTDQIRYFSRLTGANVNGYDGNSG